MKMEASEKVEKSKIKQMWGPRWNISATLYLPKSLQRASREGKDSFRVPLGFRAESF
jgi:hypothetical protein